MSERLPSGTLTSRSKTPRRWMLLITASDWRSNAWPSRVMITESGISRRWVVCGRFLGLLRNWLEQDILRDMQRWTPTEGTPQGAVISPLLANIYLHPLDERMAARVYRMVRYADDFVVLCKSRKEAEAALAEIRAWVAEN